MNITMPPHYKILELDDRDGMDMLRALFPTGEATEYEFCLFGTSGIHGAYANIDDVESGESDHLTVLVVSHRIVTLRYGHISVTPDDVPWLRGLQNSSRNQVMKLF